MSEKNAFEQLLKRSQPIILDGGLATQLEAQGYDLNSSLWSAQLLMAEPQAIVDAYLAYLNAGAQIITSASYQASIPGFMNIGLSADEASKLILFSVELAEHAIEKTMLRNPGSRRPLIAASIGPYGAYLADGSEYRGNYGISDDQLRDFHLQRLKILDNSNADILACETIPSYQEARVLADLLDQVDTPAWMSFSCRCGQYLNDGSQIEKAVQLFINQPQVLAVGINCTAPEYVSELIDRIKQMVFGKAIIVYPNSGEDYEASTKSWKRGTQGIDFCDMARQWYKKGAQIIGGCCRVGPEQIKAMADKMEIDNGNQGQS